MKTKLYNDIMPYGKHKGKKMTDIPPEYLMWLYKNNRAAYGVAKWIQENLLNDNT